jgi:hypothetical protein
MNRELPDAKSAIESAPYDDDDAYDHLARPDGQAPEKPEQQQRRYDNDAGDEGDNAPANFEPLDTSNLDFSLPEHPGYQWSESDRPNLEQFFAEAAQVGMDQEQVDRILNWYLDKATEHAPKHSRNPSRQSAPPSDERRIAEINKIMKTDFNRYERLGLGRELAALNAKRGGGR